MDTSSGLAQVVSLNNGDERESPQDKTDTKRIVGIIRWLSMLVILGALLTIIRSLPIDQALAAMNGWISGMGIWGPIVLAVVYVVATVLFIPGTILTLAAGALFGLGVGTVTVSVGSTLGASLAFLISRYVARDKVAAIARGNRRFGAIDRAIGDGGWKIVALLRLSPAIPFNLQNYLYGLTRIRFWPYVLTSWLAMLPGTFLYVYIGHVTKAAVGSDRSRTPGEWVLLAIGLLATAVVTVYITRLARRKLKEQMDDAAADEDTEPIARGEGPHPGRKAPRWRSTVALAAAALLMVFAAVYVYANSGAIEHRLASLFGPPQVTLREAYSEDPAGPTFDHSTFDELLHKHVDADGWVDYDELKRNEATLDEYLDALASAPFDAMGRNQKLALLINAYNAFTLIDSTEGSLNPLPIRGTLPFPENSEALRGVRRHVCGAQPSDGRSVCREGGHVHGQALARSMVEARVARRVACSDSVTQRQSDVARPRAGRSDSDSGRRCSVGRRRIGSARGRIRGAKATDAHRRRRPGCLRIICLPALPRIDPLSRNE